MSGVVEVKFAQNNFKAIVRIFRTTILNNL